MMGVPGSGVRSLLAKTVEYAISQGKTIFPVVTSNLLEAAYRKQGLLPPNFNKILNWPADAERFAMQDALMSLDNYVRQHAHKQPDVVVVAGHASFPHEYGRFHFRDAVSLENLVCVDPDIIINVQKNPRAIAAHHSDEETQWSYLCVDDFARWTCKEFETASSLSRGLDQRARSQGFERGVRFFTIGAADHAQTLYRLLLHPEHPVAYFSYPITGSTETPEGREYLASLLALKKRVEERFVVIDHAGISLDTPDFSQWSGATEFLRLFQLKMLMPQIDVQISAYMKKDNGGVPEISAGVTKEAAAANILGKRTYHMHPRGESVSPYQIDASDTVVKTPSELFAALDADGYGRVWPAATAR